MKKPAKKPNVRRALLIRKKLFGPGELTNAEARELKALDAAEGARLSKELRPAMRHLRTKLSASRSAW